MLPVVLAAAWFGEAPFMLLLTVAAAVAGYEWAGLMVEDARLEDRLPAALILTATVLAGGLLGLAPALGVALGGAALIFMLFRRGGKPDSWLMGAGILYIAAALLALLALRDTAPGGFLWTMFLFLVVWSTDIGAYVTGRTVGGPKLAPAISPAKTWSGFCGGVTAAVVAGLLTGFGGGHAKPLMLAAIAVLLALTAQAGDLLESAMKRRSGAGDSGRLIPGHGGILDRIDGLMPAAIVLAAVVATAGGPLAW